MDLLEALAAITELKSLPSLVYPPSLVTLDQTTVMRSISLTQADGEPILIAINADGKCLERITEAITERLKDTETQYVFAHEEPMRTKTKTKAKPYPGAKKDATA